MIKAIIKQAQAENIIQCWSRHSPSRPFAHLRISGVTARQAYNAFDEDAVGIFVFGHPTLGVWGNVPPLYKAADGGPLHTYAGRPTLVINDGSGWDSEITLDILVLGRIYKYGNDHDNDGNEYMALVCSDDGALLNSIKSSAVAWRSDVEPWSAAPAKYKLVDGSPRIDLDSLQDVVQVHSPTE